jgi:hypothetical protein
MFFHEDTKFAAWKKRHKANQTESKKVFDRSRWPGAILEADVRKHQALRFECLVKPNLNTYGSSAKRTAHGKADAFVGITTHPPFIAGNRTAGAAGLARGRAQTSPTTGKRSPERHKTSGVKFVKSK